MASSNNSCLQQQQDTLNNKQGNFWQQILLPVHNSQWVFWSLSLSVVICLGEMQISIWPSWCHCNSLSLAAVKPDWFYLALAHLDSPGQRAVKRCSLSLSNIWLESQLLCLPLRNTHDTPQGHYVKKWHHPQNCKYIRYSNAARAELSHGRK